ncbi:MAG: hypothetical protein HOE53_02490 [Candidatus Magasanikbacteria bacterium]|nr:hypothetical protein [Candidatus Magasanikbacteria bacterium]
MAEKMNRGWVTRYNRERRFGFAEVHVDGVRESVFLHMDQCRKLAGVPENPHFTLREDNQEPRTCGRDSYSIRLHLERTYKGLRAKTWGYWFWYHDLASNGFFDPVIKMRVERKSYADRAFRVQQQMTVISVQLDIDTLVVTKVEGGVIRLKLPNRVQQESLRREEGCHPLAFSYENVEAECDERMVFLTR